MLCVVAERVKTDERILFVPSEMIITVRRAEESPIGVSISRAGVTMHSSQMSLALFLLSEINKGDASFYYPWIQVMPQSFRHIPTFYTSHELHELKGSIAVRRIAEKKADLKREFVQIQKVCVQSFHWKCVCDMNDVVCVRVCVRDDSLFRSVERFRGRTFVGRDMQC